MELVEFNKIRKVAMEVGFKRNATDQWFARKRIPKEAQIKIFEESSGSISFAKMSVLEQEEKRIERVRK